MKEEVEDGRKILVFDDVEELKWHYHRLLCQGQATAQYYMEKCCGTAEEVNKFLKQTGEPCRVKKLEET